MSTTSSFTRARYLLLVSLQVTMIFTSLSPQTSSGQESRSQDGVREHTEGKRGSLLGIDLKSLFGFKDTSNTELIPPSSGYSSSSPSSGSSSSSSSLSHSHQSQTGKESIIPFDISVLGDKSPSEQVIGRDGNGEDESSDYEFILPAMNAPSRSIHPNPFPSSGRPYSLPVSQSFPASQSPFSIPFSLPFSILFSVPSGLHHNYHKQNHYRNHNFMDTNRFPPSSSLYTKYQSDPTLMNEISSSLYTKYQSDPTLMNEINVIPSWPETRSLNGRGGGGGGRNDRFPHYSVPLQDGEKDALSDFLSGMIRRPYSRRQALKKRSEGGGTEIVTNDGKSVTQGLKKRSEGGGTEIVTHDGKSVRQKSSGTGKGTELALENGQESEVKKSIVSQTGRIQREESRTGPFWPEGDRGSSE